MFKKCCDRGLFLEGGAQEPTVRGVSDEHDNQVLNAYKEAGVKHASHHLETSSAVDKARVFGH